MHLNISVWSSIRNGPLSGQINTTVVAANARHRTIEEWQTRWENKIEVAAWTRWVLPSISRWIARPPGEERDGSVTGHFSRALARFWFFNYDSSFPGSWKVVEFQAAIENFCQGQDVFCEKQFYSGIGNLVFARSLFLLCLLF